jgi:hypothetical protein
MALGMAEPPVRAASCAKRRLRSPSTILVTQCRCSQLRRVPWSAAFQTYYLPLRRPVPAGRLRLRIGHVAKGLRGRASLYKWYTKAVALKRDDPELFRALADLARPGIEEHGLDEESGVASFLREFDRDGIDPRTAVETLADEGEPASPPTATAPQVEYTMDNIEEWDFREYRNILDDDRWRVPDITRMDLFLGEHFTDVIAVDHIRLHLLHSLVTGENALGELTPDGYVVLSPLGQEILPRLTPWRDRLTATGRLHRKVVQSLVREWEKNGRLRFTILPSNMRAVFPGLFDESPADGDAARSHHSTT